MWGKGNAVRVSAEVCDRALSDADTHYKYAKKPMIKVAVSR